MAFAGIGLAYLFEPLVRADIQTGRIIEILREAAIDEPGLFSIPRRASMAPKLGLHRYRTRNRPGTSGHLRKIVEDSRS